jgi:hypothetical protein
MLLTDRHAGHALGMRRRAGRLGFFGFPHEDMFCNVRRKAKEWKESSTKVGL